MGAPLAVFETVHPQELAGCPAGTCFGSPIKNSEGDCCEFTTLQTVGPDKCVDGYTQAFPDRTPVLAAKAQVLALLPRNTKTTDYFIQHDSNGASCVLWNIKGATFGTWFADPKIGDPLGVMGIELSTSDPSGNIVYDPRDVEAAYIDLAPAGQSMDC
jgi:hypothetical protein